MAIDDVTKNIMLAAIQQEETNLLSLIRSLIHSNEKPEVIVDWIRSYCKDHEKKIQKIERDNLTDE